MSEVRAPLSAGTLADPRPDVLHEEVRAEMLRKQGLPCLPRPVLDCRHG